MVLIIGGAYQGKRDYALETLGYPPERVIGHVEQIIRDLLEAGKDPLAEIARLCNTWHDCAVLLEDISCGVVPMDAADRAWREAVGRCGAYLARRAKCVVRVFCGIGTVMKNA